MTLRLPSAACRTDASPADRPDRDRHRRLAARHEAVLRELLNQRVAGRGEKVAEHDLDDRPKPCHGHSERDTDEFFA
jgi:hypothetical protein